jgi:tripartite-type tricarboxylate transporter receptor subunit TctC
MRPSRRQLLHLAAGAVALPAASRIARAQPYPARPVTMVVPYPAGSGTDVLARILGPSLSEFLGQPVIIENLGGAGGITAVKRVARAVPDGYQLVLGGTDNIAQSQTIYKTPPYSATTDLAPVSLIAEQPFLLVAHNDFPATNVPEFIAYAKANLSKLSFGSAGPASGSHLTCTFLNSAIGVAVRAVPYRGAPQGLQDLMAGRIDYYCPVTTAAIAHIENRTIKAIATLSRDRSPILPTLASAQEQGLVGFEANYWNGVFLPHGTPAPIVSKLREAVVATMDSLSVQARLKEIGLTIVAPERRSGGYLQGFVASEIDKWAGPIKLSGARLD